MCGRGMTSEPAILGTAPTHEDARSAEGHGGRLLPRTWHGRVRVRHFHATACKETAMHRHREDGELQGAGGEGRGAGQKECGCYCVEVSVKVRK